MKIEDIINVIDAKITETKANAYEERIRVEAKNEGRIEASINIRNAIIDYVNRVYNEKQEAEKEKAKNKPNK